jgi:ABC-type Fe3+-hydroxamate transport system substrate-binding protein
MNRFILCVFIASLSISGCSNSDNEATNYASKACKIKKDSNGEFTTELADNSESWNLDDPLAEIRVIAFDAKTAASNAASAGQIDATYRPLANSVSQISTKLEEVVRIREQMERTNNNYYPDYDWNFLNDYNQILDSIRIECSALTNRLN